MCTIGALTLGTNEYLLFKNKDFARSSFNDRILVTRDLFGPMGLETFADDPAVPDVWNGLSIGANRHGLLCCVNHVKQTDDGALNYDLLTEYALREGDSVSSALKAIEARTQRRPYFWGNIILADGRKLAAVEVRGQELRHERSTDRIFRTNHQPLFGEESSPDGVTCSASRFTSATRRMPLLASLDDVLEMLATHDEGDTGICNHGDNITTVYGYVLHREDGETTLYVAHGHPCESSWTRLPVPMGEVWSTAAVDDFVNRYPGAKAA